MNVSRETHDLLGKYTRIATQWNARINLFGPQEIGRFFDRHVSDGLRLAKCSNCPSRWVDMGSGGGIPGVVVAIMLRSEPTEVILVERDRRKAAFLRNVQRELGLRMRVLMADIADALPLNADVVSARALGSLDRLLPWINRHMTDDGAAYLLKGLRWRDEVASARETWSFDLDVIDTASNEAGPILKIRRVQRGSGS